VSLVGYTNAGKSTLFNTITESSVYAADQLFATLDPTLRKIKLQDIGAAILADTVGFIRHLPHDLVAAFKATLQETQNADLLLHVVDYSDDRFRENTDQVNEVLNEIEASDVSQLLVCNKIDRMDGVIPRIDRDEEGKPVRVWISAQQGIGIDLLLSALTECLSEKMVQYSLRVPPALSKLRGALYSLNCISTEAYAEDGDWLVNIRMPAKDWQRLVKNFDADLNAIIEH
jgi:GTP-binding protein HflX